MALHLHQTMLFLGMELYKKWAIPNKKNKVVKLKRNIYPPMGGKVSHRILSNLSMVPDSRFRCVKPEYVSFAVVMVLLLGRAGLDPQAAAFLRSSSFCKFLAITCNLNACLPPGPAVRKGGSSRPGAMDDVCVMAEGALVARD